MKKPQTSDKKGGAITLRIVLGIAILGLLPAFLWAQAPGWWATRGVQSSNPANDYAAANQGQVKNIARAAVEEMDADLPSGAGDALHQLLNGWATPTAQTNDYAAVNLGQLKAVAKPFYDQLIQVGYTAQYPWTTSSNAANDYAMANIGQVKNLFSFDLSNYAAPAAPTNVAVTTNANGSQTVTWMDTSNNETGFNIESSIDGVLWSRVGSVGANVTSYTNTSVTGGGTYRYRVTSVNAATSGSGGGSGGGSTSTSAPAISDTNGSGQEGVPVAPESQYAVIDLGTLDAVGTPQGVNDSGQVLLVKTVMSSNNMWVDHYEGKFWSNGSMTNIDPAPNMYMGPLQDGSVYFSGTMTEDSSDSTWLKDQIPLKVWTSSSGLQDAGPSGYGYWTHYNPYTNDGKSPPSVPDFPAMDILGSSYGTLAGDYQTACAYVQSHVDMGKIERNMQEWGGSGGPINDAGSAILYGGRESDYNQPIFYDDSTGYTKFMGFGANSYVSGIKDLRSGAVTMLSHGWWAAWEYSYEYYDGETTECGIIDSGTNGTTTDVVALVNTDGFVTTANGVLVNGAATHIRECDSVYDLSKQLSKEGPYILGKKPNGATTLWCYNGGHFDSTELGTTAPPSTDGNVVGRKISNHLVIPLGGSIWRNGRLRTMAELTSGTASPSWAGISANLISPEKDIIAGAAVKVKNADGTPADGSPHAVLLLPIDLVDLNGAALDSGSNVSISPKKDANDTNPKSIAWIDPHRKNDGPDMPQLVLRIKGADQMGLKIRWKLNVKYTRPSGRVITEDTVSIPSMTRLEDGTITSTSQDGWVTETTSGPVYLYGNPGSWNNENDWDFVVSGGFFGGEAELTYQILKQDKSPLCAEQKILFGIRGKNPNNQKCSSFINGQRNPNEWFSDAIAKHETAEYRYAGSLYNQFRSNPSNGQVGLPTWNNDGKGKPGGYGVFQITGSAKDSLTDIPRGQIWNWQDNIRAYFAILRDPSKCELAIRHAQRCRNINAVIFDECPVANNTITYATTSFTSNDSVWITAYNGWGAQSVDEQYVFTPAAPIPANQILNRNNSFGLNTRWYWNPPLKKSGKGASVTYNSYLQLIQKQIQ